MSKSTPDTQGPDPKATPVRIAEEVLDDMQVRLFKIRFRGKSADAFLINKGGQFHAYINECKHLPVPLDLNAPTVLNSAGTMFQCHQHGAVYEIETGICTDGPCKGAKLTKLHIEKKGKHLVISVPQS